MASKVIPECRGDCAGERKSAATCRGAGPGHMARLHSPQHSDKRGFEASSSMKTA